MQIARSGSSAGIEPAFRHAARNLAGFHPCGAFAPRSRSTYQKAQIITNERTKNAPQARKVGTELVSMTSSSGLIACSYCSRRTITCARSATSSRGIRSKVFVSKICGDQIVGTPAATDVNLRSSRAYHITVAIERIQETRLVGAGIWLNSPQCAFVYEE